MKLRRKIIVLALVLLVLSSCSDNDGLPQQADPNFIPKNTKKSFSGLTSPIVFFDEAHSNFHTTKGRYKPFVQVLISDGYTVKVSKEKFTLEYLKKADILVVSNALHEKNRWDWTPPYYDAFDFEEVEAVKQWVSKGGSLFFIADHIPFPKASENLSAAFGFKFTNGHVDKAIFNIDNNGLIEHVITKGNSDSKGDEQLEIFTGLFGKAMMKGVLHSERIIQVKTFGGSAFQIPASAEPLLVLGKGAISIMPEKPFEVTAETPRVSMDGWSQGAVLDVGKGRVAVFAEGAMFTSQVTIPKNKASGLVSDGAEQNEQFLLNVMHWLSNSLN